VSGLKEEEEEEEEGHLLTVGLTIGGLTSVLLVTNRVNSFQASKPVLQVLHIN
jgi:hypothetical protein